MEIDPNALIIGGMALAHAARITAMYAAGDPVMPYMYVNPKNGTCTTHEIGGAGDEEVEAQAQSYAKSHLRGTLGCAMVAQRKLRAAGGEFDVFLIDVWYPEFRSITRLVQPFRSTGVEKGFCLYGAPIIAIDRQALPSSQQGLYVPFIMAGVEMNKAVAALWPVWQRRGG